MEISRGSNSFDSGKSCQRGHWRPAEDDKLRQLVEHYGPKNWNFIAQHLEGRSGKSCRLRWYNQLDPNINKKPFTEEEEDRLLKAHRVQGNRWASIARLFPGRTDNAVKNHFHVIQARRKREHFTCFATSTYKRSWQNIVNHDSIGSPSTSYLARFVRPNVGDMISGSSSRLWRSQDEQKTDCWPSSTHPAGSSTLFNYDSLLFDVRKRSYDPNFGALRPGLAFNIDNQFGSSSVSNGGGRGCGSQEEWRRKELVGVCHNIRGETFQTQPQGSTDCAGRFDGQNGEDGDEAEGKNNAPFIDFLGVGLIS